MTSPLQQKLRITGPVVITANRLGDGVVVHRAATGAWVEHLKDADVLNSAEAAQAALAIAQHDGQIAIGAYVAPIKLDENEAKPGNLRELIRETGPTFTLPVDVALTNP